MDWWYFGARLIYIFPKLFAFLNKLKSFEGFTVGVSVLTIRDTGEVEGRMNYRGPDWAARAYGLKRRKRERQN